MGLILAVYGACFLILGVILLLATIPLNKREEEKAMLRRARQKRARENAAYFHRTQYDNRVKRHNRVYGGCW